MVKIKINTTKLKIFFLTILFCGFFGFQQKSFAAIGDIVASWNFESGTSDWLKATNTNIETVNEGVESLSTKSLHIYGTTPGGTVASSPWPGAIVVPGDIIHLSAKMKIAASKNITYIKFNFLNADSPRGSTGVAITNAYDSVRSGTWQELTASATVPVGTTTVYSTVMEESADSSVNLLLDDVSIIVSDHLEPLGPLTGATASAALEEFSGIHPRLFLSAADIISLKGKIISEDPYPAFWLKFQADVDALPDPAETFPATCDPADILMQRTYGYELPKFAFAWLMTGNATYLNKARTIANAMTEASFWGDCSAIDDDHVAGVALFGLSTYYDWCYDQLTSGEKAEILAKINSVSSTMAAHSINGYSSDPWWKNAYLCNQMSVAFSGLTAAGFATFEDLADAPAWIQLVKNKTENMLTVRADDGSYPEGVGYWGYDMDSLLKNLSLFKKLSNVDLYDNQWLENTGLYRLYLGLPQDSWTRANQVVNLDDSVRSNWYGPDTTLRGLATEYQNQNLQWLAGEVDQSNFTDNTSAWLNLLWYDKNLSATPPDSLPTLKLFPDIGLVSARSDWSGDEALFVYSAGPPSGHKLLDINASGNLFAVHMHPDAGHFLLFADGDWQLRDDAYGYYKTENHNTLVIDGADQYQADDMFDAKAEPSISQTHSSPSYDFIKSDLTQAYVPSQGLTKFKRYMIFLKPDVLITIDDIALSASHNLDLFFHPENSVALETGKYFTHGANSDLQINPLYSNGAVISYGNLPYSEGDLIMPTFKLTKTAASSWKNAVAFSWSKTTVPEVTMQQVGNSWIFSAGGKSVTFDWDTEAVLGDDIIPPASPSGLAVE